MKNYNFSNWKIYVHLAAVMICACRIYGKQHMTLKTMYIKWVYSKSFNKLHIHLNLKLLSFNKI